MRGKIFFTTLSLMLALRISGQNLDSLTVSLHYQAVGLSDILEDLSDRYPLKIFLAPISPGERRKTLSLDSVSLSYAMHRILENTDLSFISYRDYLVVVGPRSELQQQYSTAYFEALEESINTASNEGVQEVVIGNVDAVDPSGKTEISGKVTDADTGEEIIGATLVTNDTDVGTATDESGNYTLTTEPGSYTLSVRYIGYQGKDLPVKVISSGKMDMTLAKGSILLDEIVVEAQARDENVQSVQASISRISIKELEKLPSFLGEVDIVKGLLMQPGVTSIGEGSAGFNVRGGNIDQNLIMMDEAIIFNATHALGFFSSFNSDIVSEALLYKGNLPARYGGRLSSVLDVNVRDGSFEKFHMKGGIGVVSSRLTLEGPIYQNKTSLLVSGRSNYSDWVLQRINVPEVKESSAFFYDANVRLTHRFNEKNFLSLSGYGTHDEFTYANDFGFDYDTWVGQFNYRSQISSNILSTLSGIWSQYTSNQFDLEGTNASRLGTGITYYKLKENISVDQGTYGFDIGGSAIWYTVMPGQLDPMGELSLIIPREREDELGLEMAFYANGHIEISPRLSLEGGLRYSRFQFLGPQRMFTYLDPGNPGPDNILEEVDFNNKVIYAEGHFEPRFSARYKLDVSTSLKLGYARTTQYINQLFNNETPTPTSLWQLTNQYIPPSLSHNFSLGYFRNFKQNLWITSMEVYYRHMDQLFDYKDFADLIVSNHIETEILTGTGRAMGVELSIRKQVGLVHGWLNYTYSRTERKIPGINEGDWYPANFDKPHDLSLVANLQINKRNQLSFSFSYSTGRPTTIPVDRHIIQDNVVVLNYSDRNAFRIPDYHRLDIAYTLGQGYRKSKKFKTSWTLSIYNVYGRRNAYSVYLEQDRLTGPQIKRLSVLGSAFPSLTFNFELL